jgi:hypothetical protein
MCHSPVAELLMNRKRFVEVFHRLIVSAGSVIHKSDISLDTGNTGFVAGCNIECVCLLKTFQRRVKRAAMHIHIPDNIPRLCFRLWQGKFFGNCQPLLCQSKRGVVFCGEISSWPSSSDSTSLASFSAAV